MLGVGRIRYDGVHVERVVGARRVGVVEPRPVRFEGVPVAGGDIVRADAPHDEVHSGEVVRILFQFLREVEDIVLISHVPGDALADGDEEGAGTAGGVVDLDMLPAAQVMGDDLRHELGHFVGRVEFPGLLARIGGEIADEVFIDVAQHVVVLPAVHGDVLDEMDEVAHGAGLGAGAVPQMAQTGLEGLEDALKEFPVVVAEEAGECGRAVRTCPTEKSAPAWSQVENRFS